jgi:tryptophanyl-tRNA synthetase
MKNVSIEEAEAHFVGKRYGEFKGEVADAVIEVLEPLQQRYKEIIETKAYEKALAKGAEKASKIANATLKRIQKTVGLLTIDNEN